MKLYDWNEIKATGDCVAFCENVLGLKAAHRGREWTKFNNPWRPGSDSGAFAVCKEGYHDHVSGESGSILDLCAHAKFGGDLWQAQEFLGQQYGIKERGSAKTKRRFVTAYDYTDLAGILRHQTVRWDPKGFSQRRPNPEKPGEWIWNLDGIEPVLYRQPEWDEMRWVCVVGGEKDADNLWDIGIPATTNAMGEGHWKASYNEAFRGKSVCVIPDRDDVGRKHAAVVAAALGGIATQVKVLDLTFDEGVVPHKDASDWIAWKAGVGLEPTAMRVALLSEIKAAPHWQPEGLQLPAAAPGLPVKMPDTTETKLANEHPFRNFAWNEGVDERGRDKRVKIPRHINEMRDDVFRRFRTFPRLVGGTLFDHDRETGRIRYIDGAADLIAWITEKSGQVLEWTRLEGAPTQDQFFSSIRANSRYYHLISGVPNWPSRSDVYYTHDALPSPSPDARYFKEFCNLFCPADEIDAYMLQAFVASPLYYKSKVDRPLWIIDSTSGQGSGKTKLVEMVSMLYGGDDPECCEPLWIDYNQLNNETTLDRIVKRLLSRSGRKKRIFLLDNVDGYFRSPALATLITQGSISGMAPYGHGEETRPNDMTYVITSNSATVSRDLVSRAFFIKLKRPETPDPLWGNKVVEFVRKHRLEVIADIIGLLEAGAGYEFTPATRFRTWEAEVLAPIMGNLDTYDRLFMANSDRQRTADGEVEEAEIIRDHIMQRIRELGWGPDVVSLWLQSPVLTMWVQEAIPGYGGRYGRSAIVNLRNMVKAGLIPELTDRYEKYPHNGAARRRGMMWNSNLHDDKEWSGRIKIVAKRHDRDEAFEVV